MVFLATPFAVLQIMGIFFVPESPQRVLRLPAAALALCPGTSFIRTCLECCHSSTIF